MRTYTLREYQQEIILKTLRLFESNNQAAIVAATGSGKTLMSQIVISKLNFSKVIIATPFLNIGKEFINKEETLYKNSYDDKGSNTYVVKKNSFKYVEDKKVKTISELLKSSGDHVPHIISHHALARLKDYLTNDNKNKNKIDYNNTLVVLDEAHHCSDNKEDKTNIGVVIKHICKNGGKVLYMTATPYRIFRNKPVSILPDDCHCSIKTTCALMREGYAPNIEVNYTVISQVDALQENGVGTFTNNGNTRFANKSAFIKCRDEI
jgi:superfamily II DNA or RNA helicase